MPSVVTWAREKKGVTKDVTKEAGKNVSASDENTVSHENTGSTLAAKFAQAQELGAHEEGELVSWYGFSLVSTSHTWV
jgi:hypothetical protein